MSKPAAACRRVARAPSLRPLLVFDGDCDFCRLWIERWRAASAGRVDIETSQRAGPRFPEISPAEFAHAVQLIEPGGEVYSGAEAILRARAVSLRRSGLLAAYRDAPGFAAMAEAIYRFVAGHRPWFSRLTRLCLGR